MSGSPANLLPNMQVATQGSVRAAHHSLPCLSKETCMLLVGMVGYDPTTSRSQSERATNCATSRCSVGTIRYVHLRVKPRCSILNYLRLFCDCSQTKLDLVLRVARIVRRFLAPI